MAENTKIWPDEAVWLNPMDYTGNPAYSGLDIPISTGDIEGAFVPNGYLWTNDGAEDADDRIYTLRIEGKIYTYSNEIPATLTTNFNHDGLPLEQTLVAGDETIDIELESFPAGRGDEIVGYKPNNLSDVLSPSELRADPHYLESNTVEWPEGTVSIDRNEFPDNEGYIDPPIKIELENEESIIFNEYEWRDTEIGEVLTLTGTDGMDMYDDSYDADFGVFKLETEYQDGVPIRQTVISPEQATLVDSGLFNQHMPGVTSNDEESPDAVGMEEQYEEPDPPFEQMPYEQIPYEGMPYEELPVDASIPVEETLPVDEELPTGAPVSLETDPDLPDPIIDEPYTAEMAMQSRLYEILDRGFIPAPFLKDECFKDGTNPLAFDGDSVPLLGREDIERIRSNPDGHSAFFGNILGFDLSEGAEVIKVEFEDVKELFANPVNRDPSLPDNTALFKENFDLDNLYFVKYTNSPLNLPVSGTYVTEDTTGEKTKHQIDDFKILNLSVLYAYPKESDTPTTSIQEKTAIPCIMPLITTSSGRVSQVLGMIPPVNYQAVNPKTQEFLCLPYNDDIFTHMYTTIDKLADPGVPPDAYPTNAVADYKVIKEPFLELLKEMLPSIVTRMETLQEATEAARHEYTVKHTAADSMDLQTTSARMSFNFAAESYNGTLASFGNVCKNAGMLGEAVRAASLDGRLEAIDDVKNASNTDKLQFETTRHKAGEVERLLDFLCGTSYQPDAVNTFDSLDNIVKVLDACEAEGSFPLFKEICGHAASLIFEGGNGMLPHETPIAIPGEEVIKNGMVREIENAVKVSNHGGRVHDTGYGVSRDGTIGSGAWARENGEVVTDDKKGDMIDDRYVVDKESGAVYDRETGVEVVPIDVLNTYNGNEILGVTSDGQRIYKDSYVDMTDEQKCALLYKYLFDADKKDGSPVTNYKEFREVMMKTPLDHYEELASMPRRESFAESRPGYRLSVDKSGNHHLENFRAGGIWVRGMTALDKMTAKQYPDLATKQFSALNESAKCEVLFDQALPKSYTEPILQEKLKEQLGGKDPATLTAKEMAEATANARTNAINEFKAAMTKTPLLEYNTAYERIFQSVSKWHVTMDSVISKERSFHADMTITPDKSYPDAKREVHIVVTNGNLSGMATDVMLKKDDTGNVSRDVQGTREIKEWVDVKREIGDYRTAKTERAEVTDDSGTRETTVLNDSGIKELRSFLTSPSRDHFVAAKSRYENAATAVTQPRYDEMGARPDGTFAHDYRAYMVSKVHLNDSKLSDYLNKVYSGEASYSVTRDENIKTVREFSDTLEGDSPVNDEKKTESVTSDAGGNTTWHDTDRTGPTLEAKAYNEVYDESGAPFLATYGRTSPTIRLSADGTRIQALSTKGGTPTEIRLTSAKKDEIAAKIEREHGDLSADEKNKLFKDESETVKKELERYLVDAKQWESAMNNIEIPRMLTSRHYGYQYAKLQHTYAIYAYERAGGAVGNGEAVAKGVSVIALNNARRDLLHTNVVSTHFINSVAIKDAGERAENYINDHKREIEAEARSEVMDKYHVEDTNEENVVLVNGEKTDKTEFEKKCEEEIEKTAAGKRESIREALIDRGRFEGVLAAPKEYVDANGNRHTMSVYDTRHMSFRTAIAAIIMVPVCIVAPVIGVVSLINIVSERIIVNWNYSRAQNIADSVGRGNDIRKDPNSTVLTEFSNLIKEGKKVAAAVMEGVKDVVKHTTANVVSAFFDKDDLAEEDDFFDDLTDDKDDGENPISKDEDNMETVPNDKDDLDKETTDNDDPDTDEDDVSAKDEEGSPDESEKNMPDAGEGDDPDKKDDPIDKDYNDVPDRGEDNAPDVDSVDKSESDRPGTGVDSDINKDESDSFHKDEDDNPDKSERNNPDTGEGHSPDKNEDDNPDTDNKDNPDADGKDSTDKVEDPIGKDNLNEHVSVDEPELEIDDVSEEEQDAPVREEPSSDENTVTDDSKDDFIEKDVDSSVITEERSGNAANNADLLEGGLVKDGEGFPNEHERTTDHDAVKEERPEDTGKDSAARDVSPESNDDLVRQEAEETFGAVDTEEAKASITDETDTRTASEIIGNAVHTERDDTDTDDTKTDAVAATVKAEIETVPETDPRQETMDAVNRIVEAARACFDPEPMMPTEFMETLDTERDNIIGTGMNNAASMDEYIISRVCGVIGDAVCEANDKDKDLESNSITMAADMVKAMATVMFGTECIDVCNGTELIMDNFSPEAKEILDTPVYDTVSLSFEPDYEITASMNEYTIVFPEAIDADSYVLSPEGEELRALTADFEMMDVADNKSNAIAQSFYYSFIIADDVLTNLVANGQLDYANEMDRTLLAESIMPAVNDSTADYTIAQYQEYLMANPDMVSGMLGGEVDASSLNDLMRTATEMNENNIAIPEDPYITRADQMMENNMGNTDVTTNDPNWHPETDIINNTADNTAITEMDAQDAIMNDMGLDMTNDDQMDQLRQIEHNDEGMERLNQLTSNYGDDGGDTTVNIDPEVLDMLDGPSENDD